MAQAQYLHGDYVKVDYTPGSAVTGGDVVVVGDRPLIAHRDIAANELGALATGGGVYEVTADAAISAGVVVYWNDTSNKVTTTASTHKVFGYVTPDSSAAADGDLIKVQHTPKEPAV